MAMKVVLVALALAVAWVVLLRPLRSESARRKEPPPPPPAALERCPRCGVYRLPDGRCECSEDSGA